MLTIGTPAGISGRVFALFKPTQVLATRGTYFQGQWVSRNFRWHLFARVWGLVFVAFNRLGSVHFFQDGR